MLNSERIFSDSRTLNAIEDTFFRRAMAIYRENESKKVQVKRANCQLLQYLVIAKNLNKH